MWLSRMVRLALAMLTCSKLMEFMIGYYEHTVPVYVYLMLHG
jgi:hypothetical protein